MHALGAILISSLLWRNDDAESDFLQTIYDAEVGPKRFTIDAVLCSLEDVSVAGACVIECGEEHLGRRFQLC
jgi:hypothetical protein